MALNIRQADEADLNEILILFNETVKFSCAADYKEEQLKVWVASSLNKQAWLERIKKQHFLVAEIENKIVGFGSIENGEYIDVLYVHKDYLRQGIASQLLTVLELQSEKMLKSSISSDVSITAKPFFEKQGFRSVHIRRKVIDKIEIINFKMVKDKTIGNH